MAKKNDFVARKAGVECYKAGGARTDNPHDRDNDYVRWANWENGFEHWERNFPKYKPRRAILKARAKADKMARKMDSAETQEE